MNVFKRYLRIVIRAKTARLIADLGFRMNFLTGIVGSCCHVVLYIVTIKLLMPKIFLDGWGIKEMWVLLGTFIVFCYAVFYLFWRGMTNLVEGIRTGALDFYLLKPIDSQFFISLCDGGSAHNLLLIMAGFIFTGWSVASLGITPSAFQILLWLLMVAVAILDFYSALFFLGMLNFRFGYLGEAVFQIFEFQNLSRYPIEAFSKLPIAVAVLAIPFSALTTFPAKIIMNKPLSMGEMLIYFLVSSLFIGAVRRLWFRELRRYSSASS
jgi:ABC-2 type transport system permease protein